LTNPFLGAAVEGGNKMGKQIIKQPDGLYAVWSHNVDGFILFDATPEEIIDEWVEGQRQGITKMVNDVVESLEKGLRPYYQFTMTWGEALAQYEEVHQKSLTLEQMRIEYEKETGTNQA
jgi:hypothetical protein